MIEDHQRAGDELKQLLAERKLEQHVPAQADAATADLETELGKLEGKKLEKRYVDIMLEDHRKAVDLFREQSKNGDDQALREWARKTLPKLESHLEHVTLVKAGKAVPTEMQPPKVGVLGKPAPGSRAGGHAH
jgi:putative membrane protein